MDALKIWIAKFSVVLVWHFPNFPVLRNKEIFLKNFSQNSVKIALCGVVGSERVFKRVWDSSQQAKSVRQAIARTGRFTEKGTLFLCLLRNLSLRKYGKEGKKWIGNWKSRTAAICPKKGSRQRKPSATKSATHTMKCLPHAAVQNGSATR